MEYIEFLRSKMAVSIESGFKVSDDELTPSLFPHVRDTVKWAVSGGQRAIFSSFGMQKTVTQLEILRLIVAHEGGKALVVCPRRVVVEFVTQAKEWLNMNVVYVRTMQEVEANLDKCDVFITNYERVRDGEDGVRIEPNYFIATSLDEASVLRQFDTKTYQTFLPRFANVKYKFVATATPSPNRYDEMVQYAGYLGVMDTNQAIQRFFKRDQTKNNNLTLYPHKQEEFWLWVSTWALFITKPSDLGYSDEGYELPKLTVIEEVVGVDNDSAGYDDDGQKRMFRDAAIGLQAAAKERRDSMPAKIQRVVEIINRPENINDHFLLWHDLEAERIALCKAIDGCKAVYGSQNDDEADKNVLDFKEGRLKYLAAKPEMLGEGLNFQHHCHKAIMFIDYRFNDKFQAIARIHRFMQKHEVTLYLVYAESEQEIYKTFMQKWRRHNEMVGKMADLLRKNGLFGTDMIKRLERYMFSQREEQSGKLWRSINNDNCLELPNMEDNSIGLIVTSIPFSNQYEYTSAYNDFGFNENNDKFFEQMDFLTPHLLRVLQPGRIACIHVKDRVLSGYKGGTCFQTIVPFSDLSVLHYIKHGFKYCGRITVDTDVVQENNKSYRLGYTEMCKDGTKMSVGCPEYILIFRKEPSDTKDAYADIPVVKSKDEYSLARWQIDAHAHWSDSGDRLLSYDDIKNMDLDGIRAYYRKFAKEHLYNYEEHVAFSETLGAAGRLSKESFVLAPVSHKDYIWDLGDYRRTDTLNTRQAKADKQVHICLAKGSLILTRRGYVEIQNIKVGDMVLTHKGNWKPVESIACTGINPVVRTKAQGVANLITTPDHKLWCRKTDKVRSKDYMKVTEPTWVEAKDTVGGYVNLKLPAIEETNLTKEEWWVVGRFLADGNFDSRNAQAIISVGNKKIEEFIAHVKPMGILGDYRNKHEGSEQIGLRDLSPQLREMLHKCGKSALVKQVPVEGLCLSKEYAESLLEGYLSGDGFESDRQIMSSSVSRALTLGMAMVAQRARGIIASIHGDNRPSTHIIEGRVVNQHQNWVMQWKKSRFQWGAILNDGAWKPVSAVEDAGEAETWSLRVADDASYTAEGCIVKNCPLPLDLVKRCIERWSNKGDLVLDMYGGLGTVAYCAIKLGRRGLSIELNHEYYRDGLTYLKEAEMDMLSPTLFDFMEFKDETAKT